MKYNITECQSQEIIQEMRKCRVSLDALVLPHLFPVSDEQAGLPWTIGQTWYVGKAGMCSPIIRAAAEAASEADAKAGGAVADISNRDAIPKHNQGVYIACFHGFVVILFIGSTG